MIPASGLLAHTGVHRSRNPGQCGLPAQQASHSAVESCSPQHWSWRMGCTCSRCDCMLTYFPHPTMTIMLAEPAMPDAAHAMGTPGLILSPDCCPGSNWAKQHAVRFSARNRDAALHYSTHANLCRAALSYQVLQLSMGGEAHWLLVAMSWI